MPNRDALIRIVDDDEEFVDALSFSLTTYGWKVRTYTSPEQFLELTPGEEPGCIILDAKMPCLTGSEVQDRLNALNCKLPIIFLTGHGDLDLAVHVFRQGACDFLQKTASREALIQAIERAVAIDRENRAKDSLVSRYSTLTDREKQILSKVALMLSNRAIAESFGISERTVECHRASAMKKLSLKKPQEVQSFLQSLTAEGALL